MPRFIVTFVQPYYFPTPVDTVRFMERNAPSHEPSVVSSVVARKGTAYRRYDDGDNGDNSTATTTTAATAAGPLGHAEYVTNRGLMNDGGENVSYGSIAKYATSL